MKKLLPFLLLAGCVHQPLPPVPAPSVGAVKTGIAQAQSQISDAKATVEKIGGNLETARTKAQRIDGKATVILDHWQ